MHIQAKNLIRGESNGPSSTPFTSRDHLIQSEQIQELMVRVQKLSLTCIHVLDGNYSDDTIYLSRKKQILSTITDVMTQSSNGRIDDFHYKVILAAEKRLEEVLIQSNPGECLKRFKTLSSLLRTFYSSQHE